MVQFMTFWKRENYRDQNQIPGFQGLVMRRGVTTKWHTETWSNRNVSYLDSSGEYTTLSICGNHRTVSQNLKCALQIMP